MALTNAALDLITRALIGEAFTSFANANAHAPAFSCSPVCTRIPIYKQRMRGFQ